MYPNGTKLPYVVVTCLEYPFPYDNPLNGNNSFNLVHSKMRNNSFDFVNDLKFPFSSVTLFSSRIEMGTVMGLWSIHFNIAKRHETQSKWKSLLQFNWGRLMLSI